MIKRWIFRHHCLHHDREHGFSWVKSEGRGKRCVRCNKGWAV